MRRHSRTPLYLAVASTLVLATTGAQAQETDKAHEHTSPYAPLTLQNVPSQALQQTDSSGVLQLGLGYTSDDNYMYGQYNGRNEDEVTVIGNLQWQDFRDGDHYWQASFSDLGLDTREGKLTWGKPDRLRISLGFDSQQQVRNDSGRTPFSGNEQQRLPGNWVGGLTTSDFAVLDSSLHQFDRELQRDRLFLAVDARLNENWRATTSLSYEEKDGHSDVGVGIYIDAAAADAALLRSPVDYATTEFDLGLSYDGQKLHLNGELGYSDFDNHDEQLTWQNPYTSYGAGVAYPDGTGGLGLAPDSEEASGRLTGLYLFSSTTRLQFDGSYAVASQDQDYLSYTANPTLSVSEALPTDSFDGEVATSTASARLLLRPLPKLNAELFYKLRDRDYDAERNGYLYVRGDGGDQGASALTVYNSNHDLTSQTAGFELNYRLPMRSKVGFEYAYEAVERSNAAVEETEEDRYTLNYRIQPWSSFTAKAQLQFADRAADTYQWAQSYYALLDAQLINATPDNQRYTNHPQLSQYYLSNRERREGKLDLGYLPAPRWNLHLNLSWRDDDYDQSELGLTESQFGRVHFSAVFAASDTVSASIYTGYDHYEGSQSSRSFRGGQEKNAFEIYAPLPQASDPAQDWDIDATDSSISAGINLQWQLATDVAVEFDYSFVDTTSEQDYGSPAGGSVITSDLPDVDTLLHQIEATGTWQVRSNLSLQLDYQFYSYKTDDWAWDNLQADSIDKVLTFGQTNPNEDIHYVGASVIYHWQ